MAEQSVIRCPGRDSNGTPGNARDRSRQNPTVSVKETMKGKLPQKKLVRGAADGYSSYGNQIGLATGAVKKRFTIRTMLQSVWRSEQY